MEETIMKLRILARAELTLLRIIADAWRFAQALLPWRWA